MYCHSDIVAVVGAVVLNVMAHVDTALGVSKLQAQLPSTDLHATGPCGDTTIALLRSHVA